MERWLPINEAPRYLISDRGNVQSTISNVPKRSFADKKGYLRVQVYLETGGAITRKVHRLVAEHFIPNPDAKPQVNHRDCDKTNNTVTNLEWVTNLENMAHAVANGLQKTRPDIYKLAPQIRLALDKGYIAEDIAKLQSTTSKTLRSAVSGAKPALSLTTIKVGRRKTFVYFDSERGKWRSELRKFGIKNKQFEDRESAERFVNDQIGRAA